MKNLNDARAIEKDIRAFIQNCESPNNEEQEYLIHQLDKWNEINYEIMEKGLLVDELIYELADSHFQILTNLLTLSDEEINLN
ncbi:MAG: hypothetical protein IID03_12085 [Candidatus Dadabacteria bacterium]|nr:hypothetical protein [Candidatus Dadabacteria bacterium]